MLTDAGIVDLVRRNFVPAAINWKSGASATEAERRLRKEWGLDRRAPIGVFLVLKDGTPLGRGGGNSVEALAASLRDALSRRGPLPEREAKPRPVTPDRGEGLRADGSARLALTVRAMKDGRPANSRPMVDSVVLSAAQLGSLTPPPGASPGTRYVLPPETAREFVRLLTDDGDRVYAMRSQDATEALLEATVAAATPESVVARLAGTLGGRRPYSGGGLGVIEGRGRIEGTLTFSPAGEVRSLLLVCESDYRNPWAKAPHSLGGLLEWRR